MSLLDHNSFYFGSLRNYIIYFGKIFNNVRIQRTGADGDEDTLVRVPLNYSGRDKSLLRMDLRPGSPEWNECPPHWKIFPAMGFELTGLTYDPERTLPMLGKNVKKLDSDLDLVKRSFTPAPYNLQFALHVMSKNITDGNKIAEQILPFFRPSWTSSVNLIPDMDITHDIPLILDGVTFEDRYEGELTDRRNVFWTFNFTMQAYFYGPIVNKPIIKTSNTNFFIGNTATTNTNVLSVSVTPGLDANGAATTNSAVTIASANIAIDSDFGYIETWVDGTQD